MNNFYQNKKRLTVLCFLLTSLFSFNANSQTCTPVATLTEDFSTHNANATFPINCWAFVADPTAPATPPIPLGYINEDTSVTPSNKFVTLYAHTYTTRTFYLISPAINTINGNYHLKFDAKLTSQLGSGSTLQIGTLDSQTNIANFTPVGTALSPTTTDQTFTSIAVPATTSHQYIAIKFTPSANYSSVNIDNIIWEPVTTANPCSAVATINEDFEAFTAFPENCWISNQVAPMADLGINSTSGNQFISLYSFMTANNPIYLVTPELSTIDGNHLLEFDIISTNATTAAIEIGTMTDNTNFSTFVPVGSTFNPSVGTHSSAYIPANTGHKYIAIKFTPSANHQNVSIDNVKWTTTSGISKFDTSKVMVYPNPTTDIFNVESELDIKQIEVYNSVGQKVLTTTQKTINLQSATNGLYFITVTTNNGAQASYKLIKK